MHGVRTWSMGSHCGIIGGIWTSTQDACRMTHSLMGIDGCIRVPGYGFPHRSPIQSVHISQAWPTSTVNDSDATNLVCVLPKSDTCHVWRSDTNFFSATDCTGFKQMLVLVTGQGSVLDGNTVTFLQIISYHIQTEPYSAWVTMSCLVLASHVTHLNKCVTYIAMCFCSGVTESQVLNLMTYSGTRQPRLTAWLSPCYFCCSQKKSHILSTATQNVLWFRSVPKERETEKEGEVGWRERGQTVCMHICRCLCLLCMR